MSFPGDGFIVGLLGDGISTSLSPPTHEREARRHGIRYIYRTVDLHALDMRSGDKAREAGRVLDYGLRLGFSAFNVTHPYKQSVLSSLDDLDEDARRIGAVNTIIFDAGRAVGYNTDFSGYIAGLQFAHPDADLGHVVQLGAGGAGAAIAYGLLRVGVERLDIIDMNTRRASVLAQHLQRQFPSSNILSRPLSELPGALSTSTGFAQCTPVGMHLMPGLPVEREWLRPDTWVSDVVYRPLETELVRVARERGCAVIDGGHMFVGQAANSFSLITGKPADPDAMRQDFVQLVAAH